jgi:hypothetical protein
MTDAGKAALYLRSILEELHLDQLHPTKIAVDNRGARQLTNAQQPTKRTHHIDMRDFCILQWTEEEQILYTDIPSAYNVSDSLSKPTGRIKFYEQMDVLMGRRCPSYVKLDPNHFLTPDTRSHNNHPTLQHKYTAPDPLSDHDENELHDSDDPASPFHIIGSTCCLSQLSITHMDYDDLDCYDLEDFHPFDTTSVGG